MVDDIGIRTNLLFLWDHIAIVFAVRHAFKIGILSHHNEILTEDLYNPFDVSNVRQPVNFKFMQASEFLNQKAENLWRYVCKQASYI